MPPKKSKFPILFLGTQMEVAGAQRVLLSQARWFSAHGYPVKVVFFYDKQGLKKKWQSEFNFPIISLDAWKPGTLFVFNIIYLLKGFFHLFSLFRDQIVTVVTFTPHSNLMGLPIAWLAQVPVRIGTHHGFIEGSSPLLARVHGWLTNSRLVTLMIAVSAQVREYAIKQEKVRKQKLKVVENGIDPLLLKKMNSKQKRALRSAIGIPGRITMFLTVGRLTTQKGHTVLLDAVAKLKSSANTVFVFAGEGPQKVQLQEQAHRLGVENEIRFLGLRNDINQLLLAADVFVQPSLWEGLSLALLEALFAGIPVLATRVEGVVDVVTDNKSALLVPANDSYALANALDALRNDPSLRRRLAKAGRRRARTHYSIDRMCKSYEALLLKLTK